MMLQIDGLTVEVNGDKVFIKTDKDVFITAESEIFINGDKALPVKDVGKETLFVSNDINLELTSFIKENLVKYHHDEVIKKTFYRVNYKDTVMQILLPFDPEESDIKIDFVDLISPDVFKEKYGRADLGEIAQDEFVNLLDFMANKGYEHEWDNSTEEECYVSACPWNNKYKHSFMDEMVQLINVYKEKTEELMSRVRR